MSIHFLMKGRFQHQYQNNLLHQIKAGQWNGWYVGCGKDEWQHHFTPANYRPVDPLHCFDDASFIKMAKKIPLSEWDEHQNFFKQAYLQISNFLIT